MICFDESPIQLIGEVRRPIPAEPGQIERYDCEYRRNGTANLFVFLDANRSWRKVKVTERRTAQDFAACMREITDIFYPKAERIRVVLDNLSTHSADALYQTFPADQARRMLRRLEFHYVPKHASWLNMVEIEISVLATQCLDQRIESYTASSPRPPPGRSSAMPPVPASTGCSQPKGPRQNGPCLPQARPRISRQPKSQNLCAEELVVRRPVRKRRGRQGRQYGGCRSSSRRSRMHAGRWVSSTTSSPTAGDFTSSTSSTTSPWNVSARSLSLVRTVTQSGVKTCCSVTAGSICKPVSRRWVVEHTFGLDDPLATSSPQFRTAPRRLRGDDPRRRGRSPPPPACSYKLLILLKNLAALQRLPCF